MPNNDKELAEFEFEGGSFLVEVDRVRGSVQRAALPDTEELVAQARESFESAIDRLAPVAGRAIARIRRGLTDPADEVEVKFGIKLSAEAGAILTSVGGEANFEVVLKWKHERSKPSAATSVDS